MSIQFNREGDAVGAGGLFLQALPSAGDRLTAELEARVLSFPSLGEVFTGEQMPGAVVLEAFASYSPRILSDGRVEFMCHCNHERLHRLLTLLPIQDLQDLRDNGPLPIQMRCHNCNTPYEFSREEIQEIFGRRYPHN